MRALIYENGRLNLRTDYPQPEPKPDEALIRVTLAGICSTDLEMAKGYVPNFAGVLGHEFVGVVEAAAEADWIGRRVVSSINIGCQRCAVCQQHGDEHCPKRQVLGIHRRDGAFAEFVTGRSSTLTVALSFICCRAFSAIENGSLTIKISSTPSASAPAAKRATISRLAS